MAKDKKAFILYCDIIETFKLLSLEDRGKIITWILEYVNDNNPKPLPGLLSAVVEPIKQQLKRDLKKYEARAERSRQNGKKGGRPKNPKEPDGFSGNLDEPKKPDTVTVTDTDTVSSKEDLVKGFLNWFNQQKELHTGSRGKFKVLSNTDKKNLKQLKGAYNDEDFNKAVAELYQSQWAKDTNNRTPSHFLRVDNFNRYVSAELVSNTPQRKKLNPIAANTALSNPNIMEEYLEQGWTKAEIQLISQGKHTGE